MTRPLKLLFCGDLSSVASYSWQRAAIFREFGFEVSPFAFADYSQFGLLTRLKKKIHGSRFKFPERVVRSFNAEFLNRIAATQPEIVWTEKALLLLPETLAEAKRILPDGFFVCHQMDNPFGGRRAEVPTWRNFVQSIPLYDLHFVKANGAVDHYKKRGAKRVLLMGEGFFASIHHPYDPAEIPPQFKHDTVFVGTPLDHRVTSLAYLMDKERIPVEIYGNLWNRHTIYYRHRQRFHGPAVGRVYAQVLSGSKICLGYVSWSNFDEYNGRSTEIPACGGFLLAERTPKHQEMYEEGKESEFFGSDAECADKIRFYLRNDGDRLKIAQAGYERCLKSDYSLRRYVREAMQEVLALRGGSAGGLLSERCEA